MRLIFFECILDLIFFSILRARWVASCGRHLEHCFRVRRLLIKIVVLQLYRIGDALNTAVQRKQSECMFLPHCTVWRHIAPHLQHNERFYLFTLSLHLTASSRHVIGAAKLKLNDECRKHSLTGDSDCDSSCGSSICDSDNDCDSDSDSGSHAYHSTILPYGCTSMAKRSYSTLLLLFHQLSFVMAPTKLLS